MVEILGEERTKTNELLVIKHSETIAFSPAYTFFLRQVANLVDAGHGSPFTSWDDATTGIIWAELDQKIVAMFAYHTEQIRIHALNITLTSVEQEHRGKGIHTILNRYFEKTAKKLGCKFTVATVHPKNEVRLKSAEKDGLKIGYYKLYKRIDG